jgi:hypothetical protein
VGDHDDDEGSRDGGHTESWLVRLDREDREDELDEGLDGRGRADEDIDGLRRKGANAARSCSSSIVKS